MTTQQKKKLFKQVFGEPPTGSKTDKMFMDVLAERVQAETTSQKTEMNCQEAA